MWLPGDDGLDDGLDDDSDGDGDGIELHFCRVHMLHWCLAPLISRIYETR